MLFDLRDVDCSRAGTPVLREVTASLPEGASCVAGPSGSGKSTLLRLLNRLADPDSGEVRYRGEDVRERDVLELRREVCLVPQLPALLDGDVAANVRFGAELAGREADVGRVLALAGLDGSYADRDAGEALGRRAAAGDARPGPRARAAASCCSTSRRPRSTPSRTGAIEETLAELRERLDLSLVLVTHDLAQARRLADWVVRLEAGRVAATGAVRELIPA